MFLGNLQFGGAYTDGRSTSFTPNAETSIDVWRQALALSYTPRRITGPGQVASDLARFYLSNFNIGSQAVEAISNIAQIIAQISDKQTVETVLGGVEYALNTMPDELLSGPYDPFNDPFFTSGQFMAWVRECVDASQKQLIYPIDYTVFGDNDSVQGVFNETIIKAPVIETTRPLLESPTKQGNQLNTVRPAPVLTDSASSILPEYQNLITQPAQQSSGGLPIAAVAAFIASLVI